MAFTVISPVDLNQNPRVKDPVHLELSKSFCCFCCRSGPLEVIVKLPVSGYCSGQSIPAIVECDNASNVAVSGVKLILRKVVTYQTRQPKVEKKKEKVTIAEASLLDGVAGGETKTYTPMLLIPAMPPSNLMNCGLIDLDYEVKVLVEVSGAHRNLEGKIPIVLGTIPLVGVPMAATPPYTDVPPAATETTPAANGGDGAAGGAMGWNIDGAGLYPDIRECEFRLDELLESHVPRSFPTARPTFAEGEYRATINDKNDTEHTLMSGGTNTFAPRYPVFTPTAPALD